MVKKCRLQPWRSIYIAGKKKAERHSVIGLPLLFSVSVGTLFTVFSFLAGRPAAVRSRDVFLFLGLGLHLARAFVVVAFRLAEHYSATGYYVVDVCHINKR